MAISVEERREISRRNGAKGRGPRTDAGKFKSSRNNLRHGFFAKVHHTVDENPDEIAQLRERWFADVAPTTVAEEFLTEDCFQGDLRARRVHRAYRAQIVKQQEAATASWHNQRDADVSRLWNGLDGTLDARDILTRLRNTTLGLAKLSEEWGRLGAILEQQGYWLPDDVVQAALLSGVPCSRTMVAEDEDAYRLHLWNLQCVPEPPQEKIAQLLKPANRPPSLRDADTEVLLPSAAECLERLKLWVADVREELEADSVWVAANVEGPELARLTDPRAVIIDPDEERLIHRASTEYRAIFYKAHNALEAMRKRQAAEAREATRNDADRVGSRRSSDRKGRAGDTTTTAAAPVAASTAPDEPRAAPHGPVAGCEAGSRDEPSFATAAPLVTEGTVPAPVVEAWSRDEPSFVTAAPLVAEGPVPAPVVEAWSRDEPSFVTAAPLVAEGTVPAPVVEAWSRDEPSFGADGGFKRLAPNEVAARCPNGEPPATGGLDPGARPVAEEPWPGQWPGQETRAERGSGASQEARAAPRYDPAPRSEDDWRTPPPTKIRGPDGTITYQEPWPWKLDPAKPSDQLSPKERAAIEELDRQTRAYIMPQRFQK